MASESISQITKTGFKSCVVIQNHVNRGTEKDEGKPDDKHELAERYREEFAEYRNSEDIDYIKRFYDRVINILTKSQNDSKDIVRFAEYNKDLDRLRKQKFEDVYPEFYQLIKEEYDATPGRLD